MINAAERAILFANGEALAPDRLALQPQDLLIAVDGGLRHLETLGLSPHWLVGDFDSISPQQLAAARTRGVSIRQFPSEKDQTDLELGFELALQLGYAQLVIAFGLGGRLDHTLGNLALLSRPDLAGRSLHFDDGLCEVWRVTQTLTLPATAGDLISLLPWHTPAQGVHTRGLVYPLKDEPLPEYSSRGVSNIAEASEFSVSLRGGALLVVHYRQAISERSL